MEEFNFETIASKSVKGFFALVSRTFLIQIFTTITGLILGAYITKDEYGVFFVVSSIVVFLTYFQDIGLAASLIQKKEELTTVELRTTFTAQQCLVLLFVIPALIFSRQIASFYHLSANGHILFIVLILSFFLSSLTTIPTVIMERRLDFNRLVIPNIVENIAYNCIILYMAIKGYGVTSFSVAVAARSITGLIVSYIVCPWNIGIAFDKAIFKKLVSFGLPFQANSLLALLKDDLFNLYIGRILPLGQVGYIGFSQKMAFTPLRLIMDNVIKITFPSYSRLQHDKEALKVAIEKSLFLISFIIFPLTVGISMLGPYLIHFIPRYNQWEGATFSLSFFAMSTIFSSIATPLINFLNAIGKVKVSLYFMIFWTAATWIVAPILIHFFGYNGVSLSVFFISISSLAVVVIARRYVNFSFISPIGSQFVAACAMALFVFLTKGIIISLPFFLIEIILAGIFYLTVLYVIAGSELKKTIKYIISIVKK